MAHTTIQISSGVLQELKARKLSERETYEEVIMDLIEDTKELSEETIRDIELSREEIKRGEYVTLQDMKKKLKL